MLIGVANQEETGFRGLPGACGHVGGILGAHLNIITFKFSLLPFLTFILTCSVVPNITMNSILPILAFLIVSANALPKENVAKKAINFRGFFEDLSEDQVKCLTDAYHGGNCETKVAMIECAYHDGGWSCLSNIAGLMLFLSQC